MSSNNPVHNIWEFYKVSVQLPIIASKTELDIKCRKLFVQVASRFPERLRSIRKILLKILEKSQNYART